MAEIYNKISIIAFSLSGAFLVLAVFFWFRYKINKVISDMTGRTAKKAIAQINTSAGKPGNRALVNAGNLYAPRGNISGNLLQKKTRKPEIGPMGGRPESGRLFEIKTKDRRAKDDSKIYTAEGRAQTMVLERSQEADKPETGDDYTGSERTEVLLDKTFLQKPLNQAEILAGFSPDIMISAGREQQENEMATEDRHLLQAAPENRLPQPGRALFNPVETIVIVHTEEVIS